MIAPIRWRLDQQSATRLGQELSTRLRGRRIEKLWRPTATALSAKIQGVNERLWLDVSLEHPHVRLAWEWPENPHNPDRETLMFRKVLTQGRILSVELVDARRLVVSIASHGRNYEVSIQLAGRYPNVSVGSREEGEHVRLIASRPATDDRSPTLPVDSRGFAFTPNDSLSEPTYLQAFDTHMNALAQHAHRVGELIRLGREVRALHKRTRRSLDAIEQDRNRAMKADLHRSNGELLKTVLHRVRRGMVEVEATDWASGEPNPVLIPLDPLLGPKENLERFFKLYRKYSGAREQIARRLAAQTEREREVAQLLAELTDMSNELRERDWPDAAETINGWTSRLEQLGGTRAAHVGRSKRRRESSKHVPYREFRAKDGAVIWLGRSAKDNDRLTLHEARGHDIWLHARDSPGSHVVLRCPRGSAPTSDSLLDAAMLAAWHSKLRGEVTVDVMWTHRKNVRKLKGAAPGQVSVSESRTLAVRHDSKRLERIYATETR